MGHTSNTVSKTGKTKNTEHPELSTLEEWIGTAILEKYLEEDYYKAEHM